MRTKESDRDSFIDCQLFTEELCLFITIANSFDVCTFYMLIDRVDRIIPSSFSPFSRQSHISYLLLFSQWKFFNFVVNFAMRDTVRVVCVSV